MHGVDAGPGRRQVERLLGEQEDVLAVPALDPLVVPDGRADAVVGGEPGPLELGNPVGGELLVHMAAAALARDGGREQHRVGVRAERLHEGVGPGVRDVLGHLE